MTQIGRINRKHCLPDKKVPLCESADSILSLFPSIALSLFCTGYSHFNEACVNKPKVGWPRFCRPLLKQILG